MHDQQIYIGPAGWSYPDWKGIFYPRRLPARESELTFLARYFNLVEINATFYRIPTPEMTENWVRQVQKSPGFKFVCKVNQNFTHQQQDFPEAEIAQFIDAIRPLQTADRLLTLLIQFPWSFKYQPPAVEYLRKLLDAFAEFPLSVEFRHASWENRVVFESLHQHQVTFVNIDQPVIGESLPVTNHVTAPISYYRFHGRNYQNWFRNDAGRNQRYDYLYSLAEQNDFFALIQKTIRYGKVVILVYNNHYRGQAIVNAFQMKYLFEEKKQRVPSSLLACYPELGKIAEKEAPSGTLDLFGDAF